MLSCSEIIQIVLSSVALVVTVVVGVEQVYLAKRMENFEKRQDTRDEQRHHDAIYAEATRFIQKYSRSGCESEIYLLPLCVAAYAYNPTHPYHREIYREFCELTEEVQNLVLRRQKMSAALSRPDDFYVSMLHKITSTIKKHYPDDMDIFYDKGKYFERALLHHGAQRVPYLVCELDDEEITARQNPVIREWKQDKDMSYANHITNLLAYHKDNRPISHLWKEETSSGAPDANEIVASYLCCIVARYIFIYNNTDDTYDDGTADDFFGDKYMEDIFLQALYTAMIADVKSGINNKGDK